MIVRNTMKKPIQENEPKNKGNELILIKIAIKATSPIPIFDLYILFIIHQTYRWLSWTQFKSLVSQNSPLSFLLLHDKS